MANSIWAHLGSQTGKGIVAGLEGIAQKKVQDAQRKTLSQFFPDDVSNLIISLPEKDRWPAIQALAPEYSNEQGGQNQLGIEKIASQQQLGPQGPTPINQLLGQVMSAPAQSGANQENLMRAIQKPIDQENISSSKESTRSKLGKALGRDTSPTRKEQREEQNRIDKDLKPYITKLRTEKDSADFSQPRLNKMKQLIKKGNLPVSSWYKVLKNIEDHVGLGTGAGAGAAVGGALGAFGGPIGVPVGTGLGAAIGGGLGALIGPVSSLLRHVQKTSSPDTEAFEKLSAGFLRGAKDIFGGRFTNEEMKAYLESIPTLAQTDKGKLDVINDMELFNKAAKIKYNAAQKIIKENGGRPPINLQELVEEEVREKLDKLSDIFREDL